MIRAFLSHSSSDKDYFVRIVADKLGREYCVYDEYTFEFGMRPIEEIVRGLNESQIFVLFLSEKALTSKWVQKELALAREKLSANELQRIFPIIIDKNITYSDYRIPQWVREDYNLKYVSRPTIAARRIRQRLREISWMRNPRLKERDTIFVGRNELTKQIEERVDDFEKDLPTCFVASGLPRIGRSSLLKYALTKCNIVQQSYEFPSIILRREESLEDFILKLYDLGLSAAKYPVDLMAMDIQERISLGEHIVSDIQDAMEIVIIHDMGCIIDYSGEVKSWFDGILQRISSKHRPTFLISSTFRLRADLPRRKPFIFGIPVPELGYHERRGLFKRLIEFEKITLSNRDFSYFADLFQGFPDQIRFATEMILDLGIQKARKESYLLTEFNSDKAATILVKYADRQETLDFLYLLSEFEFISLDFLFSIVREEDYSVLLEDFLSGCICDYVGIEKEFIRLNDVIRDYVRRGIIGIPEKFRGSLKKHLDEFLGSPDKEDRDVSDIIYSIKEGIKRGDLVEEKYLIPSHFIRSMRELYQEKGHVNRVIELADKLLEKEEQLDDHVAKDVRYYLCLSLARKRDDRMLQEVQKIHGPEHDFLLGFYYRLQGRWDDAINSLKKCTGHLANAAKRELVQVYLLIEDYESAYALAKSNYEQYPRNPYHIQAYFNALVKSPEAKDSEGILLQLIEELGTINSETAEEMTCIAKADYMALCQDDYQRACEVLDDGISRFTNTKYCVLKKGFLAASFLDKDRLSTAIDELNRMSKEQTIPESSIVRLRAYRIMMDGKIKEAVDYASRNLRRYPKYSLLSFIDRLRQMHKELQHTRT